MICVFYMIPYHLQYETRDFKPNVNSYPKLFKEELDELEFLTTNISKDGTLEGPDIESLKKISSSLEQELQVAILKKAVLFEKEFNKGKEPPQFMSTHPSSDTRIKQLNEWMNEVILDYPPINLS